MRSGNHIRTQQSAYYYDTPLQLLHYYCRYYYEEVRQPVGMRYTGELTNVHHIVLILQYGRYNDDTALLLHITTTTHHYYYYYKEVRQPVGMRYTGELTNVHHIVFIL